MTWSAKETIAFCALAMLAGKIVNTSCAQWNPSETHFDFSELEGELPHFTVPAAWSRHVPFACVPCAFTVSASYGAVLCRAVPVPHSRWVLGNRWGQEGR